jgi:hypothetical protein
MSDPTNVPSFDETAGNLSSEADGTESVDIEDGSLGADADLEADAPAKTEEKS